MDHGGLVVVASSLRPAQVSSLPGVCSASVSSFVREQAMRQAGTGVWVLSPATLDSAVGASLQTCSDPQRPASVLDTWLGFSFHTGFLSAWVTHPGGLRLGSEEERGCPGTRVGALGLGMSLR